MRKILAVFVLAVVSTLAQAEPASQASVERLFAVTRAEKTVEVMYAQLGQLLDSMQAQMLQGQQLTGEQQASMARLRQRIMAEIRQEMSWDKLKGISVQVYTESFSEEEIQGLIAFYEGPAGQAFLDKMPLVMQKSMALTQQRMGPMMERMMQIAREETEHVTGSPAAKPSRKKQ